MVAIQALLSLVRELIDGEVLDERGVSDAMAKSTASVATSGSKTKK